MRLSPRLDSQLQFQNWSDNTQLFWIKMAISSNTEATPLRSSEEPCLMKAGLKRVLMYTICSIVFILEYLLCQQFMLATFEGKFIEKPNGSLFASKHLYVQDF